MISLVNFVLTSVNTRFTGVSMEITTRGLAMVILVSGSGTGASVISNIANLISFKLNNYNYLLWRDQIILILHTHDLYGYVDGTAIICPPK